MFYMESKSYFYRKDAHTSYGLHSQYIQYPVFLPDKQFHSYEKSRYYPHYAQFDNEVLSLRPSLFHF